GTREVPKDIRDRLHHELKVITSKNFCSYFLIVWDFCNYARENGIPVGARGSGVGTMVGYLLGLCNVDPIKYNLLFERFMDPSGNEMPDIDIDICQDGRQKTIEYVRKKYGHVAQIITFGTLAAKAACKDVGRVLGVPLAEVDKLTKLIPGAPGMTLDKAMKQVPDLLDLFCRGETKGIFQFESGGMQDLLMKMQPDRIEDLIAANALYRPGPMELIPLYCNRKHGKESVPKVHPILDQILAETYGIMV